MTVKGDLKKKGKKCIPRKAYQALPGRSIYMQRASRQSLIYEEIPRERFQANFSAAVYKLRSF